MDCCLLPQSLKTSREIARGQNCPQTSSFEFLNIGGLDSIKFLSEFLCFTNLLLLYYLNFKYESDKIALSKYLQRSTRSSNATEHNLRPLGPIGIVQTLSILIHNSILQKKSTKIVKFRFIS